MAACVEDPENDSPFDSSTLKAEFSVDTFHKIDHPYFHGLDAPQQWRPYEVTNGPLAKILSAHDPATQAGEALLEAFHQALTWT